MSLSKANNMITSKIHIYSFLINSQTLKRVSSCIILIVLAGCTKAEMPNSKPLTHGEFIAADSQYDTCSAIGSYSFKQTEKELSIHFQFFDDASCRDQIYSKYLDVDMLFMGLWHNYLLFDQGSDESSHDLILQSIDMKTQTIEAFIGDMQFDGHSLKIFSPSEESASMENCPNREQAEEWNKFGFVILKAYEKTIDSATLEIRKGQEFSCYALN